MNIFVAGVHGVGKTYLTSRTGTALGLYQVSASQLIRDERTSANWSEHERRIVDAAENQRLLAAAVRRHNSSGRRLLLDGHFVLVDSSDEFELEVFDALNLSAVFLIETLPTVVMARSRARGDHIRSTEWYAEFTNAERNHALSVSRNLNLPLLTLNSPSLEQFESSLKSICGGP